MPYLTPENANDLLAAATHKTKFEIEQLIVGRFPRPDVPVLVQAVAEPPPQQMPPDERFEGLVDELSPGTVEGSRPPAGQLSPGTVASSAPRPRVAPLAPRRFALQVTIGQHTHEKLRYAQELLSHQVPSGDVAEVLDRALEVLIGQLEKRKFAATCRPRHDNRCSKPGRRYIPAEVKRTVWQRDGGQCTFVSQSGHRCLSRRFLELDHIDPVARGGQATVDGMRLRCRAHNQYEGERTFGAGFMSEKREQARRAAAEARAGAAAAAAQAAAQEQARDVMAGLRGLGVRADKARRAAEFSQTLPDATLEDRMRAALTFLCPNRATRPERLS